MSDHQQPPNIDDFNARLKAAQDERTEKEQAAVGRRQASKGAGIGMRIGIELLVAVFVGGAIGLFLDRWLNTSPIFTLAFVALGFAAGVLDVLRILKGLDTSVGLGRAVREKEAKNKTPPNAWDDDD